MAGICADIVESVVEFGRGQRAVLFFPPLHLSGLAEGEQEAAHPFFPQGPDFLTAAGAAEAATGWDYNSGAVSFDANETKDVEVE